MLAIILTPNNNSTGRCKNTISGRPLVSTIYGTRRHSASTVFAKKGILPTSARELETVLKTVGRKAVAEANETTKRRWTECGGNVYHFGFGHVGLARRR